MTRLRLATAGWTIPRAVAEAFPAEGSALARYAARFDACEINSTFHRSHRPQTYARWAETTPEDFRFALKVPKTITHLAKLAAPEAPLEAFFAEVAPLGDKIGALLVQLPPSLALDRAVAGGFFAALCDRWTGPIACEPRHASWFEAEAEGLLQAYEIARVAADPAHHPGAGEPGGWPGFAYWRLHGSPRVYYSAYETAQLRALAERLAASPAAQTWCVFDNTASGAAAADALGLQALMAEA